MGGCICDLAGPDESEALLNADVILLPEEWNRNRRRGPPVRSGHGRLALLDSPTGVHVFLSRLVLFIRPDLGRAFAWVDRIIIVIIVALLRCSDQAGINNFKKPSSTCSPKSSRQHNKGSHPLIKN